jgi:hypothetical protein
VNKRVELPPVGVRWQAHHRKLINLPGTLQPARADFSV